MRTGAGRAAQRGRRPLERGLIEMSRKGLGMTVVVDPDERILGVFTDGDLRRALDRQIDVHTTVMSAVMTAARPHHRPARARGRSRAPHGSASDHGAAVCDADRRLIGALNVHDLLRAGVV